MKRYEAEVFLGDYKSGHWDSLDAYLCTDVDALLAQCEEALNRAHDACFAEYMNCPWCSGFIGTNCEHHDEFCNFGSLLTAIRAARTP